MSLEVKGLDVGDLDIIDHVPSGMVYSDTIGIWELSNIMTDIVGAKIYKTIYLDGLEYVMPRDSFELNNDIRDRVDEMTEERKTGGDYQVIVEWNDPLKEIRITTR